LDFVVRARIRTVAQFEITNYKRFLGNCSPRGGQEKSQLSVLRC
jgi:hypothetical protein